MDMVMCTYGEEAWIINKLSDQEDNSFIAQSDIFTKQKALKERNCIGC